MTDDNTQLQQENAALRNERDFLKRQCDLYSEIITEQQTKLTIIELLCQETKQRIRYEPFVMVEEIMDILHPKVEVTE